METSTDTTTNSSASLEADAQLREQLQAAQHDASYTVDSVLKKNDRERTELVHDPEGNRWVRKYFQNNEGGFGAQYSALQHISDPALPQIHEIYRIPGSFVVVMEYVQGQTLRQWVNAQGPLPSWMALPVVIGVCQGVRALHNSTPPIIHRDINPNNVIQTSQGVKLIDFGIARRFDESARHDTQAWGTVGYAAPEQFGFGQSDARTDVYAIGMLYWFLLTGKDPQPDLSTSLETSDAIDPHAQRIISRCIALDPGNRFTDVDQLATQLRIDLTAAMPTYTAAAPAASAASSDHATSGPQPKWRRFWPIIAGHPKATKALDVWRVAFGLFVAFVLIMDIVATFDSWRMAFPADQLTYFGVSFTLLLFCFGPLYVLTADVGGFISKKSLFHTNRPARIIILVVVCLAVLIVATSISRTAFSPEYIAAAAAQGYSM